MKLTTILTAALLWAWPALAGTPWLLDLEAAMVTPDKNDVSVPNETGTRFSLVDDLDTVDDAAFRISLGYHLGERHTLTALYAPLNLYSRGTLYEPISFNGTVFPVEDELQAIYQFNSYRLAYTYDILRKDRLALGLGLTAMLRDAYIELAGTEESSRYSNSGVVPLVNLRLDWQWHGKLGLLVEADGAVAHGGEGRFEDVLVALAIRPWSKGVFRVGYRFLEGGADVDEIYNFAYISYFVFGWRQRF